MKFISKLTLLSLLCLSQISTGQDLPKCRTYDALDILLMKYPHLKDQMSHNEQALEEHTLDYIQNRSGGGDEEVYIVPVVFHIIHDNGAENISNEQVHDAMSILNRDFAMENEDIEDVIDDFTDVVSGDIKIVFKLAQRDPEGNCTNGIIRVQSDETYEGGEDMKDESRWPRDQYLNVWVCAYAGGAAGYSYLPSSVNGNFGLQNDGIVLLHDYTGSIGTSTVQRSRTLTHEVGHWLNLSHLWGPTNSPADADNCNFDDNVSDTPETIGWQACALSGESCGSLDNVQNYMEYSYCSRMFTEGQKDRMRAALTSIVAERNELWQEENLAATGVLEESILCQADFSTDITSICSGTQVSFEDLSFNNPTYWVWNFGDGETIEGDDLTNPTHVYNTPGTYSVTLTVSNGTEEVSATKEDLIYVQSSGFLSNPLEEGFESYSQDITEDDTWEIIEEQGTYGWQLYDNTAYSGEQCIRIRNNSNSVINDEDEIVSSTFDFTGVEDIVISYKWAFVTNEEATDDRLRVYISDDCGLTWQQKKLHRGFTDLPSASPSDFQFVPSDQSEWNENTIIIDESQYFGPSFRVKFRFQNYGGNNVYLDDINIGTSSSLSISEVSEFSSINLYPNPTSGISNLEVTSINTGKANIGIYNLTGQLIKSVHSGNLSKGSSTFALNPRDLSSGMYLIRIEGDKQVQHLNWIVQ